ncbi:MAG: ethanolamine ammonia-lyase reactivating factor EutA [Brevinemataceae bacterium]
MNYILSVGIDIGTTTSQIIFSKLILENKAAASRVPEINITGKEIIYKSDIYFTPLISQELIDGEKLASIIRTEYQKAGLSPKDITVGAVIITGESSRKENARYIVDSLGEIAGDFVVASAGPDLEGIIAGKGSGAAQISKDKKCITANVDIGGGTSNIVLFDDGVPIDTSCLDIGGRQIRFDPGTLRINYIARKTKKICETFHLNLEEGQTASVGDLQLLCEKYADILVEVLGFTPKTEWVDFMLTDHALTQRYPINYLIFSGGVAEYIYQNNPVQDDFIYNDIGILLGKAVKKRFEGVVPILQSSETIRATVIGAGAFTASLSGSTIHIEKDILPLKNIPVVKLSNEEEKLEFLELSSLIKQKIEWIWDSSLKAVVLAFSFPDYMGYDQIKELARTVYEATSKLREYNQIVVVVIENDYAKALGQILQQFNLKFIVLDSIKINDGDYLDVGEPLYENKVVPVVVKSLIFI